LLISFQIIFDHAGTLHSFTKEKKKKSSEDALVEDTVQEREYLNILDPADNIYSNGFVPCIHRRDRRQDSKRSALDTLFYQNLVFS
jgi:hypothetical protein